MRPLGPLWILLLGLSLCRLAWAKGGACGDAMRDAGSGSVSQIKWSYDKASDVCLPFTFHGDGKSANIFSTEMECLRNCSGKYTALYPEGTGVCSLPVEKGQCMALIVMWYYDTVNKKCDSFFYGGCQGNGNRFASQQHCTSTCVTSKKGKSGSSTSVVDEEPPKPGTDEGTIVAIIFSVLFAVAFIVTLTLFIRQRKAVKKQEPKQKFVAVELQ